MTDSESLLVRARTAAREIAPLSSDIEVARRLPAGVVQSLVRAGVFKMFVPAALGGAEASLGIAIACLEEIARADGSAGWCSMVGATSGLMAAFLDDDVAREIYAADDAITCGVFVPMGRAIPVEGGFRVTGRWPFASGCDAASWRMGGATIGEVVDVLQSGAPNVQSMLFRASDTRIVDTWHASGLRGSGSHDIEVIDVFVPAAHSFSLFRDKPRHGALIYSLPFFGVLAASIAAVALGIATSAIGEFMRLAVIKKPGGSKRSLAHREIVQLDLAAAEAKVSAGRAFLRETVHALEQTRDLTPRSRARLRLAACHAVGESAAAVDLMYNAAGATSVYAASPLQRHFRDIHVATQHLMVSRTTTTLAGRILLGVESDTDTL